MKDKYADKQTIHAVYFCMFYGAHFTNQIIKLKASKRAAY